MAFGLTDVFHVVLFVFYSSILWYDITFVGDEEGSYFLTYQGFAGKFKFLTFICFTTEQYYVTMIEFQYIVHHISILILYLYSLIYDILEIDFGWHEYSGKFKYLTFWNTILQTVYFGICVVNDIWGTNCRPSNGTKGKLRSSLQTLRDNVFAALAYPIGMFVVITFWSIYMVDRELVFPKRLDDIIPSWLNHVMHTTVLPILLLEKYLVYHQYPSKKMGLTILLSFSFAYLAWILWIAYYANIWVYPVLRVMEAHQRILFITLLMVFFISIYILGEAVNKFIWRRETVNIHQKQK